MFGSKTNRTGIDIGTTGVKLVRGEGGQRLTRVTHYGVETWDGRDRSGRVERAGTALKTLLQRLGLGHGLGRIVVSTGWQETSVRETELPPMSDAELQRALPYEGRKHLDLDEMEHPVLAGQILSPAGAPAAGVQATTRALMAAVPASRRDFVLNVLAHAGLEPEIVDLEPLAGLNALFGSLKPETHGDAPVGLLDLGGHHAALHIASTTGGLMTRTVAPGAPEHEDGPDEHGYRMKLRSGVSQTLTFYRGRFRRDVAALYVAGGGATAERIADLREVAGVDVIAYDPLTELLANSTAVADGPRYLTACGLCRWGDV